MPSGTAGTPDAPSATAVATGAPGMPSGASGDSGWSPAEGGSWRRPASWSLRAKLVASMLALFTVITLISSAASVVSLNRFLTGQLDDQLRTSMRALPPGLGGSNQTPDHRDDGRGPGDEGFIVAVVNGVQWTRPRDTITTDQVAVLESAGLGKEPQDLELGGDLGLYRVLASSPSPSTVVYVGLPKSRQDNAIGNALRTAVLATLAGLVAMAAGGLWLVKRNLRPLTRVAATATSVSKLHLSSGQVALAERVAPEDTDPHTEVGKVGLALNELLDHVDDALNARHESEQRVRQFVADASHELRTPLASIRGYAELTKREREPVPASVVHALGRVESEATRMSSLVEDLLLLARLDAGRPLDTASVDLTEIAINAVSDAHAASPEHKWRLELPDEPVIVQGDGQRLHQILANLLANARVHTVPGTTVLTSITREPGRVRLSVHDDGPGVPAELQKSVFQRFARGDSSRNRAAGSTGLGLSIVAAVAGAHGGTVELTSKPSDTTFSVVLPDLAGPASVPAPTTAHRATP